MPNHFYRNGNGDLIPITLEACCRTIPGCYHALRKDNEEVITFHRDCLVTKFTPEEMAEFERKKLQTIMRNAGLSEEVVNAS